MSDRSGLMLAYNTVTATRSWGLTALSPPVNDTQPSALTARKPLLPQLTGRRSYGLGLKICQMVKDKIFKEADEIIANHKVRKRSKQTINSLLLRSLGLLEEMIDNHDADCVRLTESHYLEVKKLIKDIKYSKR